MILDETPIYARLAAEMTAAPLCQVCGKPDLKRCEQEHWLLCWECFMRGYGWAEERKNHTCKVCGKFPLEWPDHFIRVRTEPDEDGWMADFLCHEHFDAMEATA